jgi:hypothetical protein
MSGAGSGVAGRSSLQDPRDSRRSEAHLRRRTGERRGSVAFVYPLGVDAPESAASLKGGRPRRKYHAVPLLTNAFSASVSMANGGSVLVEVTGRGVPIMGSAMTSSVSVGVRLDRTPCMALRTACRPRSICFSKRYRFSIMCSFGVNMSYVRTLKVMRSYLLSAKLPVLRLASFSRVQQDLDHSGYGTSPGQVFSIKSKIQSESTHQRSSLRPYS